MLANTFEYFLHTEYKSKLPPTKAPTYPRMHKQETHEAATEYEGPTHRDIKTPGTRVSLYARKQYPFNKLYRLNKHQTNAFEYFSLKEYKNLTRYENTKHRALKSPLRWTLSQNNTHPKPYTKTITKRQTKKLNYLNNNMTYNAQKSDIRSLVIKPRDQQLLTAVKPKLTAVKNKLTEAQPSQCRRTLPTTTSTKKQAHKAHDRPLIKPRDRYKQSNLDSSKYTNQDASSPTTDKMDSSKTKTRERHVTSKVRIPKYKGHKVQMTCLRHVTCKVRIPSKYKGHKVQMTCLRHVTCKV